MGLRLVLSPLSLSFYLPLDSALGTVTRDWHLCSPAMTLFAPDTSRMTKGVVSMRPDIAQAPATPESLEASMQGPPLQADTFLSSTICYHRVSTWAHTVLRQPEALLCLEQSLPSLCPPHPSGLKAP